MSALLGYPAFNFASPPSDIGWGNTSTPAQPITNTTPTAVIDPALLSPVDIPSLSHEKVSRSAVVGQVMTLESEVMNLKKQITDCKAENKQLKEQMEKNLADGLTEQQKSSQELADLRGEFDRLKNTMEEMMASIEEGNSRAESGSDDGSLDDENKVAIELSTAHANSNVFKLTQRAVQALIRAQFIEAMGCPGKLTADVLPAYPSSNDEWPIKPGTDVKAIRFHWDRPHTDLENWTNLMLISREVKENGKYTMPAATAAIECVSKDDREARIIQKFRDLVKEVRRLTGKKAAMLDMGIDQDFGVAEEEGRKNDNPVKKEDTKKSVRQSRQLGVSLLTNINGALDADTR
ncbi:hypothetical protein C0992_004372 [Termitomyces sp. T32_za158]|nr:hypothetical protein C0992_004372 [Termitomyces sp. T32_za158]